MSEFILHHYPTSPYSEKVRLAFGLKGLGWRSVTIPVIMPKPDLMPLTGGYRKTPVLQIGADIYCDTQCIMREIERRAPAPSLFPAPAGQSEALAWWAEKSLFGGAVGVVFATFGDKVPKPFIEDRAKFSGRNFDPAQMKAAMPLMIDQLRAHFTWLESMLADGRKFMQGASAGLADFAAYHCVWMIQRNLGKTAAPLDGFPGILAWSERVAAIGHGNPTEMDAREALAIAKAASPATPAAADPGDPAGRKPGDQVSVTPDDTGRDPVRGELVASGPQEIVIRREDPAVGQVHLHFPRAGFVVGRAA